MGGTPRSPARNEWSNAVHFPRKHVNDQEINGFGLDGAEILRVHSERDRIVVNALMP